MIIPLAEAGIREAGGKAKGLAHLLELGLKVPDGIVLIPGEQEPWQSELEKHQVLDQLMPAAVRSSARDEDGDSASFAGQFESYLNCRTGKEIVEAVKQCHQSAQQPRVGSYREHFQKGDIAIMPVIIQRMVTARKSGVIFTANPVKQRTDQWMISATEGLSEALMAGTETGEQALLTRNGNILQKGDLLSEEEIHEIYQTARIISDSFKRPMDIEWAFDEKGTLFCLQARPITTIKQVHLNELDGGLFCDNEVFTRANIGEMMPGPVSPLTYSVFGRAIEVGLQDFYIACGVQKEFTEDWLYFRMFYNHLFFSMTRLVDISEAVLLNEQENVEFAITGDRLGERFGDYRPVRPRAFPLRLWNQFGQFRYLAAGKKRMRKLEVLADSFSLNETSDPHELYRELDDSLEVLNSAYAHHYCTSSQSGSYQSALMSILSSGKDQPGPEDFRDAALLMSDLRDLESADLVQSIDRMHETYRDSPEVVDCIQSDSGCQDTPLVNEFKGKFNELLHKHGHRCVREAELREKSWDEDPGKLIELIRKKFQAGERIGIHRKTFEEHKEEISADMGWMSKRILAMVLGPARTAVSRREYTKSLAVKVQQKIKKAYLKLAAMMVEMGLLDDVDQVFFLTHQELGTYLKAPEASIKDLAEERRILFPESFKLRFPDHCQGYPEPLPRDAPGIQINGDAVKGLPVSAGIVEAKIRLVEKLEDAGSLEKGEIMLCQYTDVGWTPYFSLAAGLITEIGSPLSHGAVVAREYGIPAVVNAKGALGFFKNGDLVRLDGSSGIVRKME